MTPLWSAYNGRVVAFDFTQKSNRDYKSVKGDQEIVELLTYHPDGYRADMLCVLCYWRGDIMITHSHLLRLMVCPQCHIEGCMVRG